MTTPSEELSAIRATRQFLVDLLDREATPSPIPATWLRGRAYRLLKHFPWPGNVEEAYKRSGRL